MYVQFLIRWRRPILIGWALLLLVFSGFLVNKLVLSPAPVIDNSAGVWFDRKDPELVNYQAYNEVFGEKEWSVLLLQTGSIYDPGFLRDLDQITSQIAQLKHIVKATSITNVRDNFTSADGMLDYHRLYSDAVLQDAAALQQFREKLAQNPIFERNLIQKDNDQNTVILIQNDNFIDEQSAYRIELIDSINAILTQYPSIEYHALAGTTVVNAELNRAAKRDVFVFYSLVTVLLTVIGLCLLKNIRNLIVMYAVVVSSALPAMGLLAALAIPYNMVTVMLPTILIALSVAGIVHIIVEFHRQRACRERERHDSETAMKITLQQLYKPTLWTTLTTIAGFSALTLSNVFPIFQLGAFSAFGLTLACIANLVIAPILLLMLWPDSLKSPTGLAQTSFINTLQSKKYYKSGVFALLIIMLLPIYGLSKLEVDTNYIDFFSASHPTTESYQRIKQAGFAQNPIVIHLQYKADEPYSSTATLPATLAFENELKQQPEVIKLLSASDFLSEINKAFNAEQAQPLQQYNKAQIEQLLLLGELSGNDDLSDFIVTGSADLQLVAMTDYMSSSELSAFKTKLQYLKNQYLPSTVNMIVTGTTTLWANMDTQVSQTQFTSLLFISVFLALFLPLIFKSFKLGLIALLINITPLAITLGCMTLLGIKINIATALIGGIALGIVVDDTIHLIHRILQNKQHGEITAQAIDEATRTIGKSIISTSVILVAGFSCMATSQFLPTAHFGIFISLSIVLALVLDLICLPALLKAFPWLAQKTVRYRWV